MNHPVAAFRAPSWGALNGQAKPDLSRLLGFRSMRHGGRVPPGS